MDGRPAAPVDDDDDENAAQEDAVCMICFDGASLEGIFVLLCFTILYTLSPTCHRPVVTTKVTPLLSNTHICPLTT